jgi:uncharacterized protein YjbI with pentapeptide repeats
VDAEVSLAEDVAVFLAVDTPLRIALGGGDLRGANLSDADLTGADLTGADLEGATVTAEQLDQAKTLKGATMPDGTVHE